jgi:hypothetical protein
MATETKETPASSSDKSPFSRHIPTSWGFGALAVLLIFFVLVAGAVAMHRRSLAYGMGGFMQGDSMMTARGDIYDSMMHDNWHGDHTDGQNDFIGAISAINGNNVTLRSEGTNTSVAIASTTSFYNEGDVAKQSDLQIGDIVTISGTPDSSGTIQATVVSIR